jgi:hypothetical protein
MWDRNHSTRKQELKATAWGKFRCARAARLGGPGMGARGLPLARRQRPPMVVLGNFTGWLFGAGGGARRAHSLDARVVQPVEVSMKLNATCATGAYSRLFRDRHICDSLARAG